MPRYDEPEEFHVMYTCKVCGRSHTIADYDAKRISRDFEALGWGNHAFDRGSNGVEYVVLCREHNTADRIALLGEY